MDHVDVMGKRVADHFRLLMNLLRHKVLVVALVDELRRRRRFNDWPLDLTALLIANFDALARDDRPITIFKIADGVCEWRKRDCVRAKVHLALAVADRERRAFARSDQKVVLAGEQEGKRES